MESLKILNKRLEEHYGLSLDGRPNFRLIHSSSEFVKEYGEYEDFHGEIFIRKYVGIREFPKYYYLANDKGHTWVLERLWHSNQFDLGSSYEPCWAFYDADSRPVYPEWKYVKFLVDTVLHGVRKTMTASDYWAEDQAELKKEIEEFEQALGGGGVCDMPNQTVAFVKPVFLNMDGKL